MIVGGKGWLKKTRALARYLLLDLREAQLNGSFPSTLERKRQTFYVSTDSPGTSVNHRDPDAPYRQLVEATSDIVWSSEPDGSVSGPLHSWQAFTGQTDDGVLGTRWISAVHPDDREALLALWQAAVGSRSVFETEYRLLRYEGQYRHVEVRGVPLLGKDGEVTGWIGRCTDIHDRKELEQEFDLVRTRLGLILDSIGEGVEGLDPAGRLSFENPAATRILGWDRGEISGRQIHEVIHHSRPDGSPYPLEECPIMKTIRDGQPRRVDDEVFWKKDGSSFPVEYTCAPMRGATDSLGAVVIFRDITERQILADKLARYSTELQRSNRELEHFAYVSSHDLQEPLRAVASFSQLLARRYRGNLDEEADEFIGHIVDGAHRMQALIEDLLTYSRVQTRANSFQSTDCERIVAEIVHDLALPIAESGAKVTHDPLPTIVADRSQLAQVFQNLLTNALKFRRTGVPPRIHIGTARERDGWRFDVSDNGIGIDAEYFERIFVIFQRLHGREQYPGTGIGLALCKKIVERHGGVLALESEPGKGTTFHFTIPDHFEPGGNRQ